MKKRSILSSPHIEELKRRKRKILKVKIIFFFICFLILFVGFIFLSRWKKLNIENLTILGNKVIETKIIENVVWNDLSGHYFWVFPKTNFILYPKKYLKNDLSNKFKRFSDISISINDFKNLEIEVKEREGKYTWCGNTIPILNNLLQKCYFMDSAGYIFDEAPYFSGNVYFKFYGQNETGPGSYFLKDEFSKIINFRDNLERLNLKPNAFWQDGDDANISLSQDINGPKIIFKLDSDYEKIYQNLQTAISAEPLHTDLKNKFPSLLYFDLRFGNKVYFKFSAKSGFTSGGK